MRFNNDNPGYYMRAILAVLIILLAANLSWTAEESDNATGKSSDNSFQDFPWYAGMGSVYLATGADSIAQWSGIVSDDLNSSWGGLYSMNAGSGSGGYIEFGKSLYDRSVNIALNLIFADTGKSSLDNNITVNTSFSILLLEFEYVHRRQFNIDFYLGFGLGGAYTSNTGHYSNMLTRNSDDSVSRYTSGDFDDLSEWTLAYNLKMGVYLSSNLPLSLRIGLQLLCTGNIDSNAEVVGRGYVKSLYHGSSDYGNATQYTNILPSITSTSGNPIQAAAIEIGVQFLFDT